MLQYPPLYVTCITMGKRARGCPRCRRRKSMDAYRGPSQRSARERSARAMVKAIKVLGRRQAKPSEYVLDGGKDAAEQWLLEMGIGYHLYRMYASDGTLLYIG